MTGLGRSTWNYHQRHESSAQSIRRLLLRDLVAETFVRSRGTYGYRRIRAALAIERGLVVNKKLVRRLMSELEISGLPRKRKGHRNPLAAVTSEDLVERHFVADNVNQLWLTDITEHPTREAKVYCCCVLDMCSRKIVGWSIDRLHRELLQ